MGVSEAEKELMFGMPPEKKWKLIITEEGKRKDPPKKEALAGKSIQETPQYFIEALNVEPSLKLLAELRVVIATKDAVWMENFLELNGHRLLLQSLEKSLKKPE